MDDLTQRLRDADRRGVAPPQNWTTLAADEIDALRTTLADSRAYVDRLKERIDGLMATPVIAERDALRAEVDGLRAAIATAYGYLWCINTEPGTPSRMYDPMDAAYAARKVLRELLTTEQRGSGINAARDAIDAAIAARKP